MRFSQWLLGGATAAAIAGSIASGCGGSTNNNTPVEAGADVAVDSPPEAAKEAAAETGPEDAASEACAVDADLTTLQPPDAAIGDSGATASGCFSCIKSTCTTQLSACNADCTCKTAVEQFLACVAGGGQVTTCGAGLAQGGGTAGLPLGLCVAGSAFPGGSGPGCLHECGVSIPEGGAGEGGGEGGGGEGGGGEGGGAEGGGTDAPAG
jgi:hypothetical protein